MSPAENNETRADPDDFQLIDVEQLKHWFTFVLHSLRRRRLVAVLTFLAVIGSTWLLLWIYPRTYHIETQLLAQRNTVMPALGNPNRTVPLEADSPTRAAAETVLRRDNLLSLMKQTDLLNRWEASRSGLLRFKDRVENLINGPPLEDDRVNAMIGFLEKQITVVTGDSTITIAISWPDAELGFRLVDAAQQNFLEQRHAAEVSTIAETISILEGHANNLREAIDTTMEDLRRAREPRAPGDSRPPVLVFRRDPAQEAVKAEAAENKVMLDGKRRAINELEDFRRRRLAELQAELGQARAVYADAHPTVVKLLQSIRALQDDSPQLLSLRRDEQQLMAEGARLSTRMEAGPTLSVPRTEAVAPRGRSSTEDLGSEYARTRLRFGMEKYDVLLERIDSARIELDTARAAFKYRYSIIRPAMIPKRPLKPKVPLFAAGGFFAALGLAVLAAVLADLRSGRILETWQVERLLGVPVLGEMERNVAWGQGQ